jgi:hypothetical protein
VSTWQDLVTASLIGTERAVVPAVRIPGCPGLDDAVAGSAPSDPAEELLDRAALLTAARRAGRVPDHAEPQPAAGPDPRPAVSQAAGRRLARILAGEHLGLLDEWLTAAVTRGLRPPDQLLPALLDLARRASRTDSELRRLVVTSGGSRALWLAGLNPDWTFVAEAASWAAAGAGERVMFLSVLAAGPKALSLADEPLLEAALGQRMADRALRSLRIERGIRGTRLAVSPPAECDASMRRDGIAPGPAAGRSQLADRTRLMLEVIARTPLRTWTHAFAMEPATIVTVRSGDWAPVLYTGWARAAIAQRDQDWMTALIVEAVTGRPPGAPVENEALSQLARRADPALGAPDALAGPEPGAPAAVRDAIGVLRFRYEMGKELDDDHSDG